MNITIVGLIASGALAGGLASLIPSKKLAIGFLCLIPIVMLVVVQIELSDPNRPPDALDALLYLFGPLWPSMGAFAGFMMGRELRA